MARIGRDRSADNAAEGGTRYRIERKDGTVDGLGDAVTFASESQAWEAAETAFGNDPASDGPEGVRAWLRVAPVEDDALTARLREMGATLDGNRLVLEANHAGTGSPRVVFELDGCIVRRDGVPMSAGDVHAQIALDGPVALWLGSQPTAGQAPAMASEHSYLPIDVGFDLRVHPDMAIELPAGDELRVRFMDGDEECVIGGPRGQVAAELVRAGYRVKQ